MTTPYDLRHARYERAGWWLAHGVAVVPLKPRSKELQPGYGWWLASITDIDFARQWFLNTPANLGVVLGGPASLVVGDWDNPLDYEIWRAGSGAAVETLTERTARGYHVFFTGEGLTQAAGSGCEFKTRGVCMVSPSVHPSGTVYRVVNDSPLARLDHQSACVLFPFLSEAPSKLERQDWQIAPRLEELAKRKSLGALGTGVVARLKAARPIVQEMHSAGVKLQRGGQATLVGLCPFHPDRFPSLWVYPKNGLWGCNQPNCIAVGVHDVINFRALHAGISNQAAIKQLADEFLKPSRSWGKHRNRI